jgi:transcriptional regulator of acetoin/glycerol metabolism
MGMVLHRLLDDLDDEALRAARALTAFAALVRDARSRALPAREPDTIESLVARLLSVTKGAKLEAIERAVIAHALKVERGNVSAAARLLGVNRHALARRMKRRLDAKRGSE